MKTSRALLGLALLTAAPLAPASGQAVPVASGASFSTGAPVAAVRPATAAAFLTRGARVRLRVPMMGREKIAGTVLLAQGDSVVIDTVDATAERRVFFPNTITVDEYRRLTLPLHAVDSIEVSTGRSRGAGIRRAAKRGALILGLLGAATFRSGDGSPNPRNFLGGYINGAAVGLVIGGAIGATRGGERWQSVPGSSTEPVRGATIAAR